MLFVDERVEVKITRKYVCVALQIDNSTKSIQGQPHIWSKIPWLKALPSLETIVILLNELRDIYVCFLGSWLTMMEAYGLALRIVLFVQLSVCLSKVEISST